MASPGRDHATPSHTEVSPVVAPCSDAATSHADVFRLQRLAGNRAVGTLLGAGLRPVPVQRMGVFAAKTAFDAKTDEERKDDRLRKYGELVREWLKVQGERAGELLAPIEGKVQLEKLLDEWELDPHRPQKIREADERLAAEERRTWLATYQKLPVFQKLTAGVAEASGAPARLERLLINYRTHGPDIFDYTMVALRPAVFFRGGKAGDCNTLTYSFREIAANLLNLSVDINSSGMVGFPGQLHDAFASDDRWQDRQCRGEILGIREPLLDQFCRARLRRVVRRDGRGQHQYLGEV